MSTSQRQVDTSLGELAAAAAVTGCPLEQVQQMCEASEFTRGLTPGALRGAVVGIADGVVDQSGTMAGMVSEVAEATEGLGEGVPGQEICAAGEALSSHAGQLADAATSIGSCAGALDALTAGCAEVIGSLTTDVCGLVESAMDCGAGDAVGTVVHQAVSAITDILEQRNCGLEKLVDTTLGVCAAAAEDIPNSGCATVSADVTVSANLALTGNIVADVSMGAAAEGAGDVTTGSTIDTAVSEVEPAATGELSEQPGSVDPLRGMDKSDYMAAGSSPVAGAAEAGETAGAEGTGVEDGVEKEDAVEELGGEKTSEPEVMASAGNGWDPDIWTTSDPQ